MDSPLITGAAMLTCHPDVIRHIHAGHSHGHCHHWVIRSEFHNSYFTTTNPSTQKMGSRPRYRGVHNLLRLDPVHIPGISPCNRVNAGD